MATLKQITANRANAKRSTGPKTPEGKAASSQNATRHGALAQTICLEAEDKPRFEALLATFTDQFQPRNPAEARLVESLAIARWHRMRLWAVQKATFEIEMASIPDTADSAPVRAALAFRKLADQSNALQLLQRSDTAHERQYNRAFNILMKLQASNPAPPRCPPPLPASRIRDIRHSAARIDHSAKRSQFAGQPEPRQLWSGPRKRCNFLR